MTRTEQFICECECEVKIQCEHGVCKKTECEADECVSICEQELDNEECCGGGCCNENIVYDEFGC